MRIKKHIVYLLALVMCLTVAVSMAACDEDEGQKTVISSDWTEIPENTNPNLKYFGFYHSDGFQSRSYIDDIGKLDCANVMYIDRNGDVRAKLAQVASYGCKAILEAPTFFRPSPSGESMSCLRYDYEDIFDEYVAPIEQYVKDGTVYAFYMDEPTGRIKEEDFRTVTKMMRDKYPDTRRMVVHIGYSMGITFHKGYTQVTPAYNEFVTDVAYDWYGEWNDEQRETWLNNLKASCTNNQNFWAIPCAFSMQPESVATMIAHLKGFYAQALNEPRYVGILAFSYADGFVGDWGYGLTSFLDYDALYFNRELRQLYVNVGRKIIGKDPYDFSKDVLWRTDDKETVYEKGDTALIPEYSAEDGNGKALTVSQKLYDPDGTLVEDSAISSVNVLDGNGGEVSRKSFTASKEGLYKFSLTAGTSTRDVLISVRKEGEIASFDTSGYTNLLYTTDWGTTAIKPEVKPDAATITFDSSFKRVGVGSVKIDPVDTWAAVHFARADGDVWHIGKNAKISMWIYGEREFSNFLLRVYEPNSAEFAQYEVGKCEAGRWTKVEIELNNAEEADVQIAFLWNGGADPVIPFWLDDVTIA